MKNAQWCESLSKSEGIKSFQKKKQSWLLGSQNTSGGTIVEEWARVHNNLGDKLL